MKQKQQFLSNAELAAFFGQMAMIQHSGIPSVEGITMMEEDASDEGTKTLLASIHQVIDETGSLHPALEASGVFPDYALNMIRIGELSGNLDEVMTSLSDYYEREDAIHKEIRSAVTYPLVMVGIMLAIVAILLIRVMPVFQQVYRQLGSDMTGLSGSLLHLGNFLGSYGYIILLILAVLGGLVFWMVRTRKVEIPFLRDFYEKIAAGRFASGMALTLSSGLDTDESLDMIIDLVNDARMGEKIKKCREMTAEGTEFSEALAQSGIFSGLYSRMISVGYRVGSVDTVMKKVAQRYQEETQDKISALISVIEPSLVALLSLVVGVILLSVILPLLGILSGMGGL